LRTRTVSPFSHQLTRFGLVNCYLVHETGGSSAAPTGFTLIDTGIPGSASSILAVTEHLGAQFQGHIRRILLTHAHGDHIGSLDALTQPSAKSAPRIGGAVGTPADIAISQRESPLLPKKPHQNRSLEPSEPQCKIKGSLPGAAAHATHLLTDGELYGSLRAIATPGHTPGHFSFLDERDGTLYAGDALLTVGGSLHIPGFGPWFFPFAGLATWHRPTAVASIRRLLTLPLATPIQRIAPGHGPVLTGGVDLLASALSRAHT
jgi:glyoxylase-like metal-dependent hydrolase (beta-lactamase superfamily II)